MHSDGTVKIEPERARTWVAGSLVLQFLGYVYDALWHGVLHPGNEPTTRAEMVRHLSTVHLPLYMGAACVLISTGLALIGQIRRSATGVALPIAFAGAVLSAASEAWHASSHLELETHNAPTAGVLSVIGFLVVVVTMSLARGIGGPRSA